MSAVWQADSSERRHLAGVENRTWAQGIRGFGTTIASAIGGLVLAGVTMSLNGHEPPSQDAFRIILAIGAAAALLAGALAALLPRQKAGVRSHR